MSDSDSNKGPGHTGPDRIDDLKKKLYSHKGVDRGYRSNELHDKEYNVPRDWEHPKTMAKAKKSSILNSLFWASFIFFVLAAGFAFLSLERGFNSVSPDNISITVSGPSSIPAGEELKLEIRVRNNNDLTMQNVEMLVEYPEGTRDIRNLNEELNRETFELSEIEKNREKGALTSSVLFGSEKEVKKILISLEYSVPGSGATFSKEIEYEVTITSSPVSIDVEAPHQVSAGQQATFDVEVKSTSEEAISNLLLVTDYPSGFEFVSADTSPTFDNNIWLLGDLEPGDTRNISISGRLNGQDGDEKALLFEVGTQSPRNEKVVGVPFSVFTSQLVLERPLVALSIAFDGDTAGTYQINGTDPVRVDVNWRNNTGETLTRNEIKLSLAGIIFDKDSIQVNEGTYNPSTQTFTWDSIAQKDLLSISSGESGNVSFTFRPVSQQTLSDFRFDPELIMSAEFKGVGQESRDEYESTSSRALLVTSELSLKAFGDFQGGPFVNTGALPPKEGEEITYTITLQVLNNVSETGDIVVEAMLPDYVEWLSNVSPDSKAADIDVSDGKLIWDVGDLEPGEESEILFQISIVPDKSSGTVPILEDIEVAGVDFYTSALVNADTPELVLEL